MDMSQTMTDGLPQGWRKSSIGDVSENISRRFNFDEHENIVFINTGDVLEGEFLHNDEISKEGLPGQAKKAIKKGDILYSEIRPGNKRFARVDFDSSNYVVSTKFMVIKHNEEINFDFFYKFMSSSRTCNNFQSLAESRSGTFPQITFDTISDYEINLPPLAEQQAIASVLSSFDDKIELLREQNETLENIAQTLFKEWFGKWSVDRPEELPEGWRVGKITDVIKRKSIPYKCVKTDIDNTGTTPIIDQGADGLYGYTTRDPDFFASTDKPVIVFTNHTCNFRFVDYPFCAIQNVIPYHGIDEYDEYYLYFHTKGMISFTEYKGHRPSFVAIDTIIPSKESASKFSAIAKPLLRKISDNNTQIQSLSKTRDALLPKLMSGKVRVRF